MGQLFSGEGLTQQGSSLNDPKTGQATAVGSPQQILQKSQQELQKDMGPGGDPSQLPKIGQASYPQAATQGATPGGANATSPALTKAGKLATLLTSGLQGALAGRAKSEETVAATGGRRSGGAGMGFEAGYTLPWQRASQQNQLAQQQAQTALTQSQSEMVQTPYGMLPAGLAKAILPASIRGEATQGAAQTRAGATEQAAQTGAGARVQGAQIGADARIKAAQMGLGPYANVPQDLQDQFGLPAELPLKMLNQAETAANKPLSVAQGENGPAVLNKTQIFANAKNGVANTGLGSPRLGGPIQAGDPNNPGQTIITTGGKAQGMAGTQSASVAVPKQEMKAEVPTKIGDLKVGFTTMIQHADLLRNALKAVNNKDNQTLNSLRNSFKNEFNYTGPITAQAIADAYSGEVTSVVNKGHITNQDLGKTDRTINPSKMDYAAMDSVLSAYQALGQSKMNMLNKQARGAVNASQPKGAPANDPLGIR